MPRPLLAVCLLVLALPAAAQARPGDLDESFSADGLVSDVAPDAVIDMAVGPADAAIVVTQSGSGATVSRYTADGALDPSFAGDGAQTALGPGAAAAVDIRPDGRIIVGGTGGADFLIDELSADGSPACSGADVCAPADFAGGEDRLKDVVAEPGGGTLAAGLVSDGTGEHLGVARFLPSGALDSSFAGDGKVILDSSGIATSAENAVVAGLPDGSVLLAGAGPGPDGSGSGDLLLAKLEPDGDLDPTFGGGDGWITVNVGSRDDAESIAMAPDGTILVGIRTCAFGLTTDCDSALARFTPAGEPDPSFGTGGIVVSGGDEVSVGGDGSIYAAGQTELRPYFSYDIALSRYLPTGALDPAFSGDGVATADFDLTHDFPIALDLTSDGRPVILALAGTRLGLARFEIADGPPNADADGRLDDQEACPERYSRHISACPRIDRELRLRRATGGRLRLKIRSGIDLCAERRPFKLLRVRKGPDPKEDEGRTNASGRWLSRELDPDRYRAWSWRTFAAPIGRCARVTSKVARVR